MNKPDLIYQEGYCQALQDLHKALKVWEPAFKSDRRNNIFNIVAVLDCLIDNPDVFADYVDQTPLKHKWDKKSIEYFIDEERWPIKGQNVNIDHREEDKP